MQKITQIEDDRIYQSAMFEKSLGGGFLGSPDVVGQLVADYCMTVRDMIVQRSEGTLSAKDCTDQVNALADQMSFIFSGRDPQYKPIIGWNSVTLGARIKVALKTYWDDHKDKNNNDPIKTLFAWLFWAVFNSIERSNGDPDMEGIYLADHTGTVIRLLLGTDARA